MRTLNNVAQQCLISMLLALILCGNLYANYYKKNVQEVPPVWKKVMKNTARLFLHPGGKLPGYFDRRMKWFHVSHKLSQEEIKRKKAFIVFYETSPKVGYIDLKHVKRIFAKNKKWDTYDLAKMLKLSGGAITFDRKYEPILQIGSVSVKYPLKRWGVAKLNTILKKLIQRKDFGKDNAQFTLYLQQISRQNFKYPHEDIDEEKFFFVLHSINQAYRVFQRKSQNTKFTPRVSKKSIQKNPAYTFSLIPFKKGDLDKHASYILQNGVNKKFTQVALFLPIYYSGGSTSKRKMQRYKGPLSHHKDYFYEDSFAIDDKELERCLDKIWQSGLSLTFVPHLESIHTLNRIWESSWRIYSDIPLDQNYFQRAYRTLFRSIRKNQKYIHAHQQIRITIASEIDPAFLTETKTSYELIQSLKREIRFSGLSQKQFKLVWNPNGDFLHGWHDKQSKPSYDYLLKICDHIDSIAPSMYEKHKHIIGGSYSKSRRQFKYELYRMIRKTFPEYNTRPLIRKLNRIIYSDFSLGEFGLRDEKSKTNYIDFHREFRKNNPSGNMILWSSGSWDHANVTGINPNHHEKAISQILEGF